MEACESLEPEMTELQELQSEASEAVSQDDEDELEELQNSLREVVQDQSVKPKLQCLMVDPSFSMVTVQSEDSGIVWETASSRCSTPWASETSSISEAYSMDGSGSAGKITIVFDEEKIVRRRIRSGGRSSRLGDRLSRPGSSRSTSALGVERPEMMEVSLPNVKEEKTETEPDLEEIKNKDQQLFSLISEGYEILNIRVPSKLPTVDEEESTELHDNLSYLDQTPQIRSRNHHGWTPNHILPEEGEVLDHQEDSSQPSADTEAGHTPTQKESISDFDYFENFTLLDHAVPAEQAPELQQEKPQPPVKPQAEEQTPSKETATDSPSASKDSFVFVTDVDMVGEHLDEVFYGEGSPADAPQRKDDDEADGGVRMRMRRESQRMMKEGGSVLFGSEETTLTPIYISAGPPKIIDQILLEEPTAMSFMYSDLYEDAVGQRQRSDEECSEAESITSEKSYKRRFSDSDEAEGYLEKFILKDETSTVEAQPESLKDMRVGRMMFSQSKFEMTGCLTRMVEEAEIDKTKTEEPKIQEVRAGDRRDDVQSATFEEEVEVEKLSMLTGELEEESVQGFKLTEVKEMKHEVKKDQAEPQTSSTDEPHPDIQEVEKEVEQKERESEEQQREEHKQSKQIEQSLTETKKPYQTQEEVEKMPEGLVKDKDDTAPEESVQGFKLTEVKEMKHEVKRDQAEPQTSSTDEPLPDIQEVEKEVEQNEREREEHQREEHKQIEQSLTETKQPHQTQEEVEKMPEELVEDKDETAPEESIQGFKLTKVKEMKHEVKRDQAEPHTSSSNEPLSDIQEVEKEVEQKERESEEQQREEHKQSEQSLTETKQPYQTQEEVEKMPEELVEDKDETAPENNEVPQTDVQSEIQTETSEKHLSEEAAADTKMEAADEKTTTEAKPVIVVEEEIITSSETSGELKASVETSPCEETEDIPEDVGPVEVITDCDSAVQAVVEVTEKAVNEKEIQTQVQIDLQEATHDDTADVPTATLEAAAKSQSPEFVAEAHQESEVKTEISSEVAEPVIPEEVEADSDEKHYEIVEALQQQPEESMTEVKAKTPTEDTGTVVQDMVSVGDELILLVPKGQAVEMDIDISQWSDKTPSDAQAVPEPDSVYEHLVASEDTPMPIKETKTETQLELEPEVHEKVEEPLENYLDRAYSPPAPEEEVDTEEKKTEEVVEEDEGVFSPLRTFTPLEDLSGLQGEDIPPEEPDVELKAEVNDAADAPEAIIIIQDVAPDVDLQKEDKEKKMEQDEVVEEAPEAPVEELEYEVISKQDAEEMPESETQRDAEESRPESGQSKEERRGVEMKMEEEEEEEEKVSTEEELIEADYDIIDAEEENQSRLAAELQGMDWFCLTCGCLLPEDECELGKHQSHDVMSVDKAYEEIKEKLSDWISELQGRSENIEDLVSELELAYNSVEDQCVDGEVAMQAQNEEMMALVMEQYNNMSVSMEEEKKAKLEQLYDQIVSFQESIDTAKATLETTAREAETDARSPEDIRARLEAALDSAMSLELGPKGLLVFEDYAKGNTSSSHVEHRKGIPVPQRPTLQPQEPGTATSTSVTVYWKVNPGDIIDCFQVYCMEDPHGAVSEEYRVTVKESYCVLEELEPDKTYKVWVMAVNYTGCSLPSDRLAFTTAPSVPVIDTERCSIMWDSATLRWQKQTPGQSYTLEYCRQYDLEGEGLRTISGIRICEQRVLLQPNENYLFYIKAVNEAGASEQSEAALISTKGTRFHLLKASAHPALELSEDQTALHFSQDTRENMPPADKQCPSVLGELLSARGRYYWETIVSGSTAYRLGVAYSAANRDSSLGENSQSWCLQCVPTPSGCRYQLLYNHVQSSVFVIEMPERVGTLLDYQLGRLSFYNPLSGQLLGTFSQRFTQPCHPALALEMPGSLEVRMVLEVPEFTKDS